MLSNCEETDWVNIDHFHCKISAEDCEDMSFMSSLGHLENIKWYELIKTILFQQ